MKIIFHKESSQSYSYIPVTKFHLAPSLLLDNSCSQCLPNCTPGTFSTVFYPLAPFVVTCAAKVNLRFPSAGLCCCFLVATLTLFSGH